MYPGGPGVSEQAAQKRRSVLFRLVKGFLYGSIIGLFSGTAMYLLAGAVTAIANNLPVTPEQLFALIFGASVTAGIAKEYSDWLEGA